MHVGYGRKLNVKPIILINLMINNVLYVKKLIIK